MSFLKNKFIIILKALNNILKCKDNKNIVKQIKVQGITQSIENSEKYVGITTKSC